MCSHVLGGSQTQSSCGAAYMAYVDMCKGVRAPGLELLPAVAVKPEVSVVCNTRLFPVCVAWWSALLPGSSFLPRVDGAAGGSVCSLARGITAMGNHPLALE